MSLILLAFVDVIRFGLLGSTSRFVPLATVMRAPRAIVLYVLPVFSLVCSDWEHATRILRARFLDCGEGVGMASRLCWTRIEL